MEPKAKLFIGTPMYGGLCHGAYAMGLLESVSPFMQAGIQMYFCYMMNESLITRARNSVAHDFLASDATHLMFIDADIGFNANDIVKMVDADKDIICGLYPKKEINWQTVEKAVKDGVDYHDLGQHTGSFVVNLPNGVKQQSGKLGEPMEIENGGTGFMLIKREVLTGLIGKVPYYLNNVLDINNPSNGETIHEFFATQIEEDTKILLSEDYDFCKKARNNGFKVWAAPWVQLSHIGTYAFEGRLLQTP